jgi:serine/threonine-protein kinase
VFEIGAVLENRYRLQSEGIAQDLGTIYRAYDLMADGLVDVLVLPETVAWEVDILARLRRAQQAVASLGEADLVPYEYAGRAYGQRYLVRRHMEGRTLAELLTHHGRLQAERAVDISISLCRLLERVHRAGLVHGSLSPYCVFVRESAATEPSLEVAVTDVGLMPALRLAMASPDKPWGRSPYLSPEQAAGKDVQSSSDVYVLGSLVYAMLTGRPPFRAVDEAVLALQHLRQEPPALQILVSDTPAHLAQIVHNALSKEPAARYRNAGQLAHILSSQLEIHRERDVVAPDEPKFAIPSEARPASQERLVVPPPPLRPIRRVYEFVEDEGWDEEQAGVDWLMIGLLAVATIAVLGLIPLWRAVHQRYVGPPPLPPSEQGSEVEPQGCSLWLEASALSLEERSACEAKLPADAFLWYNATLAGRFPNGMRSHRYSPFWESSLRVFTGNCCIIVYRQQVAEA